MAAIKLIEIYQENKPWSQAHIHQRKLEPILETKIAVYVLKFYLFLMLIN
jgi:lipopolysaccharide biosynthesis regulator YciM